jgi:hypothetical protein
MFRHWGAETCKATYELTHQLWKLSAMLVLILLCICQTLRWHLSVETCRNFLRLVFAVYFIVCILLVNMITISKLGMHNVKSKELLIRFQYSS